MKKITTFFTDQCGATAVEYAVMLALIAAVCIIAISLVGLEARGFWVDSSSQLEKSIGQTP